MKPLWTCPKCGAQFVTPNMSHSCGIFELAPLFARCQPHIFPLFEKLVALVETFGPVTVIPQKTRIVLTTRVRFINIVPRKTDLKVHIWLPRRVVSPRFAQIIVYTPRAIGHVIHVKSEADFDDEFREWVRESYDIGLQKYL
jgi:Domain of unknown function (DUF5655)